MRFQTVVDSLSFAWDQVVVAFWARYPNPFTTHVLTEDVIRREIRPDGSLYTCRLLMKTNPIPKWGQALMPARLVPIIEESIVDPKTKTLTTLCRNVTYKSLMENTEKVVYTSVEDENGKPATRCDKMFWVSSRWYGLVGVIEMFGAQRWVKNIDKTRRGFEHVLEQIYDDDVEEDGLHDSTKATTAESASATSSAATSATVAMHPFIFEKRRMLKERAALMGHKAKVKFKQPLDQAKGKLERTRENAKVTIENAQDNIKDKFGVRG